ncbi:hypothetical protein POCGH01_00039700 [Plasmodium ovale]|uniref:Uncharacterized protein n=1 Tax=Plasmodium ovale TaxID=36330 RepID=A0A1D3KWZ1_PLAOA|nr:hypothetical protein POCGH01_00039700 [Plasmodium ovale]
MIVSVLVFSHILDEDFNKFTNEEASVYDRYKFGNKCMMLYENSVMDFNGAINSEFCKELNNFKKTYEKHMIPENK